MQLINTDGMVLIGPGSEWFWTAISGVGLVVTFVAIYRQLRIMRNSSALEQLDAFEAEVNSERMLRCELEVLVAVQDGTDPVALRRGAISIIWAFWERTGALVRRGHLDAKLLYEGSGGSVIEWWRIIEPHATRVRLDANSTDYLENFEWLAQRMVEFANRTAGTYWSDLAAAREVRINSYRQQLQIQEAVRATPVATTFAPAVEPARRRAHSAAATGDSRDIHRR